MTILKNIKSGVASVALATGIIAAAATIAPQAASAQESSRDARTLTMSVGRGQQFNLPRAIADVTIADPSVVDAKVTTARQLYLFAKQPGETTVYATDANGGTVMVINVRVGNNIDSIDQMMKLAMPEADIAVTYMNGVALLTGTVKQPEDAAEAERLAEAFLSGNGSGPPAQVVSRLQVATPLQVNLQVRIAEVNRSLAKEISSNLQTQVGNTLVTRGRDFINENDLSDPTDDTITFLEDKNSLTVISKLFGIDVEAAFDMAERSGLAATLATPNLTTISGETGNFQAGGSFPIPTVSGLGGTSVQFQNYGVILSYTPTVLSDGRIQIRTQAEVSDISSQGAVRTGGVEIPGTTIRRVETTVELGSGQSMMVAGLLQNNLNSSIEKFPILGDIPILGQLFSSRGWRKNETELVIMITPYLVKPTDSRNIKLPTDGLRAPNDLERFTGQQLSSKSGGPRPGPAVAGAEGTQASFSEAAAPAGPAAASASAGGSAQASASGPGFSFDQ